jgi:hypothetical protein
MTPAHADSPSSPNGPPPYVPPPAVPPTTAPPSTPPASTHSSSTAAGPAAAHSKANVTPSGSLASTGGALPVGPTVGVGIAAVAVGAGALTAARLVNRPKPQSPEPQ